MQADETMHDRIAQAIEEELIAGLRARISGYNPVATGLDAGSRIGDIEDANVLAQNSLWLNVPFGKLAHHQQVDAVRGTRPWAPNQLEQIELLGRKFTDLANRLIRICL